MYRLVGSLMLLLVLAQCSLLSVTLQGFSDLLNQGDHDDLTDHLEGTSYWVYSLFLLGLPLFKKKVREWIKNCWTPKTK